MSGVDSGGWSYPFCFSQVISSAASFDSRITVANGPTSRISTTFTPPPGRLTDPPPLSAADVPFRTLLQKSVVLGSI
jgi:hypothetical protein